MSTSIGHHTQVKSDIKVIVEPAMPSQLSTPYQPISPSISMIFLWVSQYSKLSTVQQVPWRTGVMEDTWREH